MAKRQEKKPAESTPELKIKLADKGVGSAEFWQQEIEDSTARIRDEIPGWRANLQRYEGGKPTLRGFKAADTIGVAVQFYTVEQKKPQLVFQVPLPTVKSKRGGSERASTLVQAILRDKLGEEEMDIEGTVGECLSDCLITAGIGPVKIGYDERTVTVNMPTNRTEPDIDPATGLARIDPTTQQPARRLVIDPATGKPEEKPTPKVVWSRFYCEHFSPADLRLPVGFTGTNFDRAPWIGWRFNVDEQTMKKYGIESGGASLSDDMTLLSDKDREKLSSVGSGYEIWYRAHLYDPTVVNPERIRRLVFIPTGQRGTRRSAVLIHEDSKWQLFQDEEFVGGMKGYPIHPLMFRGLIERTFPKSDCTMVRDAADEKSMGRTLMIQQRKRNLPLRGYNKSSADAEAIKKLEDAEVQEMIGFNGDPRDQLYALPQSSFPPENFGFDRIIQEDIDRVTASGANQQALSGKGETATEASIIARAIETRLAKERGNVIRWLVGAYYKTFALIQLFASDQEVTRILGKEGADEYVAWKRQDIQGQFAFSMKPDSALRKDAEEERQNYLKLFNLVANHPRVESVEMIRQLMELWGIDTSRIIIPEPPKPPEEKPKLSLSIKGDDFNPSLPQYPNIVTLMQLFGVTMAPPTPAAGAAPGPLTAAEGVPAVNQHASEVTGKLPGPRVQ